MNIKVQNMCQTGPLIIRTEVCDSFICLEKEFIIFRKHCLCMVSVAHSIAQLSVFILIEAIL